MCETGNVQWGTDCGLLCDTPTFEWIAKHCEYNILVVTKENEAQLKTFHFYKEILVF